MKQHNFDNPNQLHIPFGGNNNQPEKTTNKDDVVGSPMYNLDSHSYSDELKPKEYTFSEIEEIARSHKIIGEGVNKIKNVNGVLMIGDRTLAEFEEDMDRLYDRSTDQLKDM